MNTTNHPYNRYSPAYNFFFHPLHFQKKEIRTLAVITNICVSFLTGGLFQIPFWIINRLDNRKLEIWRRENTPKVHAAVEPIFNPAHSHAKPAELPPTPEPYFPNPTELEQAFKTTLQGKPAPQPEQEEDKNENNPMAELERFWKPLTPEEKTYHEACKQLTNDVDQTFIEKLLSQDQTWNALNIRSDFNDSLTSWTITLTDKSKSKLKPRNSEFLQIRIPFAEKPASWANMHDELFKRFSKALEIENKCRIQLENVVFDEKGECRLVPKGTAYRLYSFTPIIKMVTDKIEIYFFLQVHVAINGRFLGSSCDVHLKNADFELSSDDLFSKIQSLLDKDAAERAKPLPLPGDWFKFYADQPSSSVPLQSTDIDRLDEILKLKGVLKEAYRSGNKQQGLELLADSKMRHAALKFHPDKVEDKEVGERLFKEFWELGAKAKRHFSNL